MAGEQLIVERIENGTVIDHIPAGMGLRVLAILGLGNASDRVALLMNVPSRKLGKKDIVKVAGKQLDEKEVNRIALLAPNATLNLVKNSEVVEKVEVRIPSVLVGVSRCPNPKCVTNSERVETRFVQEDGKEFRCGYCEMLFEAKELIV